MVSYGIQEPTDQLFKAGAMMARSQVPVKTGYLRSSIRSVNVQVFGAKLLAEAPYALYVDKRVPYFSNAVEMIQRELPGLVQKAINEQAGRISRKYFKA